MNARFSNWLRSFLPGPSQVDRFERMRACAGALFGLALCGAASYWLLGGQATPWLIAPMGASAVLLFAVPASPLAQPWSLLGGNLVSGLIGVLCAKIFHEPILAAAIAVSLAIAAMMLLRCVHPPSGAVALTAVLGGPAVHALGFSFLWAPLTVNSLLLLATALFFNNTTGRRYPHTQQLAHKNVHDTGDEPPTSRLGISTTDLEQALRSYNQILDISRDDLEAILLQTEQAAYRRRFGELRCEDIMSRDVVSVEFATDLETVWQLLRSHRLHVLPVLDKGGRILGMIGTDHFLQNADAAGSAQRWDSLRRLLLPERSSHSDKPEVAGQMMSTDITTVRLEQPMTELVTLMADQGHHQLPVIDSAGRLRGMLTQSDLVAALFESSLGRLAA
jgi:CBS domain-containing membrane protein